MPFEIQAHRGARAFFPENTVEAFCRAADLGVRVVEFDVLVSGDHRLVVSHDPWLSAPLCCAPDGSPLPPGHHDRYRLYRMPYEEIVRFSCGLPDPAFPLQQATGSPKPLLSRVFREVDAYMQKAGLPGEMTFNLELKSWPAGDNLLHPPPDEYAALLTGMPELSALASRIRVQSFDRRILLEVWKRAPGLCFGLLVENRRHFEPFPWEPGFVPAYVNPYYSLLSIELADSLHDRGVLVIPWTVNRIDDMLAVKCMGADGIITDHPELALQLSGLTA
ncbi:MAG: glycerophosphodiester phosphodiesterase [Chlorobi bacterium]|nr:glycerophosphodiester phosphodiesterase [Chlorobiota bacterium]